MMHGPCGAERPSCLCTVNKCTKKFPKQFNETTFIDESGYAIYKRRNDGCTIKKSRADLHNSYVVPYNPGLLRHYQSHINVEWCNQIGSIKYLFEYINKGSGKVIVAAENEEVDEISDYYDCRYLSACEATWRIYGFDMHYRFPPLERLPFHLPNEQSVIFDVSDSLDYTLDKASVNETKFQAWMERNKTDTFAQKLLYVEFSKYYVWKHDEKVWLPMQKGKSIGRIHHVPPSWGEMFYLPVLLNKEEHERLYVTLKDEQKGIYQTIMGSVDKNKGVMFFVCGYGGTGKTYLYKTMSAACRSQGGIVLNVASSGIAALLSEGDSELAELLRMTKLIIWDEAPIVNRHCYEAFDRTMRDICRTDPSTPSEQVFGSNSSERNEIQDFVDWILNIMNGKIGGNNDGEENVEFPDYTLILDSDDHIGFIIHETYPYSL
uniref:ATP-dependent DNA helicase n=1 Tax=Tanacetum cinerariifolium TaxID=118510 RepID=A0A699HPW3_TANCI|nr:hypothetical protein [Tanacetum cinerariifolium]